MVASELKQPAHFCPVPLEGTEQPFVVFAVIADQPDHFVCCNCGKEIIYNGN